MSSGFESWKDVLDVLIIPVSLALIALAWPWFQLWYRRRRFIKLIRRELEELAPYQGDKPNKDWTHHQPKNFIHQNVFMDFASNLDFILTLPPDLVYDISQLWFAREEENLVQWEEFLDEVARSKYGKGKKFREAYRQWKALIPQLKEANPVG